MNYTTNYTNKLNILYIYFYLNFIKVYVIDIKFKFKEIKIDFI